MLAFAIDMGFLYDQKRDLQVSTDAAALGGTYTLKSRKSLNEIEQAAFDDAVLNGFKGVINEVTVHTPPISGTKINNNTAVEVVLRKAAQYYFLGFFIRPFSIQTRAVASYNSMQLCALVLGSSAQDGMKVIGSTQVTFKGCGININSPSSTALTVSGNGSLTADTLSIVGNYSQSGSGSTTTIEPINTGVPYAADPYAWLNIPSYTSQTCIGNSYSTNGTVTLTPGRYCNGISLKSKAQVALNPGIYIIDRGGLSVAAQSTLTGQEVTIIFTSSTNTNYGTANFGAGAKVTLSAPTSGTFNGILFFSDRRATTITTKISGGANTNLTGLLYFPSSSLEYVGGSGSSSAGCLKFIARALEFTGNSSFVGNNCSTSSISIASGIKGDKQMRFFKRSTNGAAAVEFALILPILFSVVVGISDFGVVMMRKNDINIVINTGFHLLSLKMIVPHQLKGQ